MCPLATPLTDGAAILGWLSGGGNATLDKREGYEGELLQLYASLIGSMLARQRSEMSHLEHVRELSREAERNLEEWQARVARELHDELGQLLTAINLELNGLERHTELLNSTGHERLKQTRVIVNTAMAAVRDLSKGLRPPIIEHKGLSEAIRSYVSEFQRYAGVVCHLRIDPAELEANDPYATAAYRIVQEALTNVARHAQASACNVSLRLLRTGKLQLKVRDNGVGAPPGAISQRETLGVIGMKERASSVGGSLSITSQQGRGVCITAILPWPK
jgi:signal transduction histidine kinase